MPDQPQQTSSSLLTVAQNIATAINRLATVFQNVWPRTTGSFTMPAAATFTVTQPNVKATSVILLSPMNAAAGTLMGSAKALYVSSITAGASFTVATASAANAVGTETFDYAVFSPS